MDILVQTVIAGITVLLIAIVLDAPKRSLPYVSLTGALGWCMYLLVKTPNTIVFSTFLASSVIAFGSHLFSRRTKTPTTVFLISALYPFVPGSSMYRAVYALIGSDMVNSNYYFMEALMIAGAIATAVFTFDSIFILLNRSLNKRKKVR